MSKNNRPVRALFPDIYNLTAQDIASSAILKDLLKAEVPKAIRSAHKEKKIYACIFEINASNYYIEIHKKDWLTALETCVMFNVESENYEACTEINEIMKEVKASTKSPKIKLKSDD
jgi:hypothetical protein